MRKGFLLLLDTILAILLLVLLILSMTPQQPQPRFNELMTIQKIHDLELLWSLDGKFEIEEMKHDTRLAFPFQGFEISVNDEVFQSPLVSNSCAVSSEMEFVDESLRVHDIRLLVYC